MELDVDAPIGLLLEQLASNTAWLLLQQRLQDLEKRRMAELVNLPATADPREIQRLVGFIEGLREVLGSPDRTVKEWQRRVKERNLAQKPKTRAHA